MATPTVPAHVADRPLTEAEQVELQFDESLPYLMVTLLERRYLTAFTPSQWRLTPRVDDLARPWLREVLTLGRPRQAGEWAKSMPHVLNACHDPGHAVLMVLHGQGSHTRLYLGARRLVGFGARSTEDYLAAQQSAFAAYFAGLTTGPAHLLDDEGWPALSRLVQRAPAITAITGIPSGRGGLLAIDLQSIDRLASAVGNAQYLLMVVAEPLAAAEIDGSLDTCRRLKSEIHAHIRRTISWSTGGSEGESTTKTKETSLGDLPMYLEAATIFLSTVLLSPGAGMLVRSGVGVLMGMKILLNRQQVQETQASAYQWQTAKSWQRSGGTELLNANAEACEALLQATIDRLSTGRSHGWWRTAIYVVAENEAVQHSVVGALRSVASGDLTTQDPLRTIELQPAFLRGAIERGQILTMRPSAGNQGHPLGPSFDALATCLNSNELAVVINLPQQELAGLPMHDHSDFALSTAPPGDGEGAVVLGTLQDNLGRDLGSVAITSTELNRHCFVTGATGYGKTNTCMQILLEAYDKLNVPALVIEPAKAEYRRLIQVPKLGERLRVYSVGGDNTSGLAFRLNPFFLLSGVPLGRHIDLIKAVFNASFPMFAGMPYVLEEAILDVYTERGWSLYTSDNPYLTKRSGLDERSALMPCLADLHDQIEVVLERKKYAQEIHQNMGAALRSRLKSLMVGNKGLALNTHRGLPLDDLFAGPTVIELQNLGDDEEKAFVMALLFTYLYEYAEIRQRGLPAAERDKLRHLTLIEEAHRLLKATPGRANPEVGDPAAKAVSMFTDMLAEMRAYGEGFIIADQIPTKLAPEILKNSNLKIVHRLMAPDDRQTAGNCMNLNDQQIRHLNTLRPGLAVVHDERIGEAVLVRVKPAKETHAPQASDERYKASKQLNNDRIYLYRHAGCHKCPAPCQFLHWVEELDERKAMDQALEPFLASLLLGEVEESWANWQCWRQAWFPGGDAGSDNFGTAYCAATQIIHAWLARLLVDRRLATTPARQLRPEDRLARERAARALGDLVSAWLGSEALGDTDRQAYIAARKVLGSVVSAPPIERPDCAACPARCRLLSFIAPHVIKAEKSIAPKLVEPLSAEARLQVIRRAAELQIPILASRKEEPGIYDGLLYCLLANAAATVPAAARGAVMALLRPS